VKLTQLTIIIHFIKLTADDDQQLRTLTDSVRKEVVGETGWKRLGILLVKIAHFDKAEELYNALIEQTSDEGEKALYYNNLGSTKYGQGGYEKAIEYYEKTLEILEKTLPPNHPNIGQSYNSIGLVYDNMREYSKALPYFERALDIMQYSLPPNHPNIQTVRKSIEILKKKL
jgi:tetratricopeptide (TPR) repeat protein